MDDGVRRLRRALCAVVGMATAVALLAWAAGLPFSAVATLRSRAAFDASLVAVASLAAWMCLLWFAGVLALEFGATIPGAAGRACARVVSRCAPTVMRHAARWLVGTAMLATPLIAAPAMAASGGPSLDRPVAAVATAPTTAVPPAAAPSAAAPSAAAPSAAAPSAAAASSGLVHIGLDRPVGPYLPPPPPPAVKTADDQGVSVLTGSAHRDVADDTYVVRRGDALWDIAARHLGPAASAAEIAREWPRWYEANRAVIGDNPNVIRPGEVLRAPAN